MSDTQLDRPIIGHGPSLAETLGYRALFSFIFIVSVGLIGLARVFGADSSTSLWTQARQAAHATAGYTFQS
ncbi:MAG: hypothetical protein AAF764_11840 [Pseudomonadota bacterium]